MVEQARELSGTPFIRTLIPFRTLLLWPNCLPEAPLPNIIALGNRISTYEFQGNAHLQSTAAYKPTNVKVPSTVRGTLIVLSKCELSLQIFFSRTDNALKFLVKHQVCTIIIAFFSQLRSSGWIGEGYECVYVYFDGVRGEREMREMEREGGVDSICSTSYLAFHTKWNKYDKY